MSLSQMVWPLFLRQAHERITQWQHSPILKSAVETLGADTPVGHVQVRCCSAFTSSSEDHSRRLPKGSTDVGDADSCYVNEKHGGMDQADPCPGCVLWQVLTPSSLGGPCSVMGGSRGRFL